MQELRYYALGMPNRRTDRRMETPRLTMTIQNAQYQTVEWSFGGFRIENYRGSLSVGDEFIAHLSCSDASLTHVIARVVRRDRRTGELAAVYEDITPRGWQALERAAVGQLSEPVKSARGSGERPEQTGLPSKAPKHLERL